MTVFDGVYLVLSSYELDVPIFILNMQIINRYRYPKYKRKSILKTPPKNISPLKMLSLNRFNFLDPELESVLARFILGEGGGVFMRTIKNEPNIK